MARKQKFKNDVEETMERSIDELMAFDEYQQQVAPVLRKAVAEKWTLEKIAKEFEALMAARLITTALTEKDTMKALAAQKEAFDRFKGKSMQRQEVTNKFDKLSDEELDNLLAAHEKETNANEPN